MNVFLSQNNNEIVVQLHVLPEEIRVRSPYSNERRSTIQSGDKTVLGRRGVRTISIETFVPTEPLSFSSNDNFLGMSFVRLIETLRSRRLPFRITVTEPFDIDFPVEITHFEFGIRRGGRIGYRMDLEEFKF